MYRDWLYREKISKKFGRVKLDEHVGGIKGLEGGMIALRGLYSVSIGAGYWRSKIGRKFGRVLMKFGEREVG